MTVAADITRAEIEEALTNLTATLRRTPEHWTDRRAALHRQINQRLTEWETATPTETEG